MWGDLNDGGLFTISDVKEFFMLLWAWVTWIFHFPANVILWLVYLFPSLVTFFELRPTYEYTTNWVTGITSGIIWILLYLLVKWLETSEVRQKIREAEQFVGRIRLSNVGESVVAEHLRRLKEAEYDEDEHPWQK